MKKEAANSELMDSTDKANSDFNQKEKLLNTQTVRSDHDNIVVNGPPRASSMIEEEKKVKQDRQERIIQLQEYDKQ